MLGPMQTDGRAILRGFIDERFDGNVTAFARKSGIDRVQVLRILNGSRGARVSVDFAYRVHRSTSGRVKWDVWVSPELRAA
jgi:hypothetical protein